MAIIALGALALTVTLGGGVWAVVAASMNSAQTVQVETTGETVVDGTPFFRADQLSQFFVVDADIEQIAGRALGLTSGGRWYRAGTTEVQPPRCAAVFGVVDEHPAGAREQSDLGPEQDDRSIGTFFQRVYQFAPADAARARFDEIAQSFSSCARVESSGGGMVAEVADVAVVAGDVNTIAATVTLIYGMDNESFVIVAAQTANVISVSVLWSRYEGYAPLPPDARSQLVEAMTNRAAAALEWLNSGAALADDAPLGDEATTDGGGLSAPPPSVPPVTGPFSAVDPARFANPMMDGVHFISPSGNLGCIISPPGVYDELWGCTIGIRDWEFPSDSPDDFCFDAQISCGRGIEAFGMNVPEPRLRGDVGYPAAMAITTDGGGGYDDFGVAVQTLEYGSSVTLGPVTCYSEQVAITCHHAGTGHGFSIARDRNQIY